MVVANFPVIRDAFSLYTLHVDSWHCGGLKLACTIISETNKCDPVHKLSTNKTVTSQSKRNQAAVTDFTYDKCDLELFWY